MTHTGYLCLRAGILEQAERDLITALRSDNDRIRANIPVIERFLLSEWGQALSDGNGRLIIDRCRTAEKAAALYREKQQKPQKKEEETQ